MQIDEQEMIDFFKGLYTEEQRADETKAGIREDLRGFAESHEANPKVINAAYNHFKKIASGKNKIDELGAINELNAIIEKWMSTEV